MSAAIDWTGQQSHERNEDGLGKGRDFWRSGWRRDRRCRVRDPKTDSAPGRDGWRSSPVLDGQKWWVASHEKRRDVVRALRMAGYCARRRYARRDSGWIKRGPHLVPSWTYEEGPVGGLEAVDPWVVSEKINRCASEWQVPIRVRKDGSPLALPLPSCCGMSHACPVCAARSSRELARKVRAHIEAQKDGGSLALVTLTQTAIPDESLTDALARWRRSWDLMTKGRAGQRFKERIAGYYYGLEVTRKDAPWWHLHAHIVVELRSELCVKVRPVCQTCGAKEGRPCRSLRSRKSIKTIHRGRQLKQLDAKISEEEIRNWFGKAWETATRSASGEFGWDPYSGTYKGQEAESPKTCRARLKRGNYEGRWWRSIDREKPSEVYQACKYPTPITTLSPVHLVEFLAVAHGRRWHQGGLGWRSIRRLGERAIAEQLEQEIAEGTREDLGRSLCSLAPGHSPSLDQIVEGRGLDPQKIATRRTKKRPLYELTGGSEGTPTRRDATWILSVGEHEIAESWESLGYGRAGTVDVEKVIEVPPKTPGSVLHVITHPEDRRLARYVVKTSTTHPTFTMFGDLALALLLDTEDLLRPPDSVPDPDLAGRAAGPGHPSIERSQPPKAQSPAVETG